MQGLYVYARTSIQDEPSRMHGVARREPRGDVQVAAVAEVAEPQARLDGPLGPGRPHVLDKPGDLHGIELALLVGSVDGAGGALNDAFQRAFEAQAGHVDAAAKTVRDRVVVVPFQL